MYPQTNPEKAALYFKAVDEIRARLRCVDDLLTGNMAPLLIHEFCQLQLRLAAECLAIACLAAQGDFETHKAFRDRYEPGAIFRALEALYPAFFPTPSIMQRVGEGRWHFDGDGHGNTITRADIEEIWNLSGAHLHRGSAKRYLTDAQDIDLLAVARLKERFWNLLMDHLIVLADQQSRFHVHVERNTDDIQCHFLFLDREAGTARVEPYNAIVGERAI
ncbi:hypothetical protein U4960_00225 [Altererythrobacter sp. H2]|uniref:hypothetical protein n=1 Tax=Erythrobacteraceae TaxID=335929 RepID=UPI001E2AE52A|nr:MULTISPECIES: hypothetical protein [Erythrobacteraceae]WRK95798.1 hypothetical protein U4960_00225 [Altererythrobacter sp. H2]